MIQTDRLIVGISQVSYTTVDLIALISKAIISPGDIKPSS